MEGSRELVLQLMESWAAKKDNLEISSSRKLPPSLCWKNNRKSPESKVTGKLEPQPC